MAIFLFPFVPIVQMTKRDASYLSESKSERNRVGSEVMKKASPQSVHKVKEHGKDLDASMVNEENNNSKGESGGITEGK
jgi:hypothetical protein